MQFIELLVQHYWLGFSLTLVLGLLVGSFLNVVIFRLPLIMKKGWREECQLFLHPEETFEPEPKLTLSYPASSCPSCGHKIRWYENIPVISWVFLAGKCSACKTPISFRYPLVEIITAICSVLVFFAYGATLQTLFGLVLVWCLIALAGIDFDTQLLPDSITMPLLGLGLAANALGLFTLPVHAIWGLIAGFLSLWVVNKLYYFLTMLTRGEGRQGIGYGDFKLLAALGAWMGWFVLPLIIFLSSLLGSIVGMFYFFKNKGKSKPFAFGPFIAIAGFIAFLYGGKIINWYLTNFVHIGV